MQRQERKQTRWLAVVDLTCDSQDQTKANRFVDPELTANSYEEAKAELESWGDKARVVALVPKDQPSARRTIEATLRQCKTPQLKVLEPRHPIVEFLANVRALLKANGKTLSHLRSIRSAHGKLGLRWYLTKLIQNSGLCELCGEDKLLIIDHDHTTGFMRGLICASCNTALPEQWENIRWMGRAIEYLLRDPTGVIYQFGSMVNARRTLRDKLGKVKP